MSNIVTYVGHVLLANDFVDGEGNPLDFTPENFQKLHDSVPDKILYDPASGEMRVAFGQENDDGNGNKTVTYSNTIAVDSSEVFADFDNDGLYDDFAIRARPLGDGSYHTQLWAISTKSFADLGLRAGPDPEGDSSKIQQYYGDVNKDGSEDQAIKPFPPESGRKSWIEGLISQDTGMDFHAPADKAILVITPY